MEIAAAITSLLSIYIAVILTKAAANQFNVSKKLILLVVHNRIWKHVL